MDVAGYHSHDYLLFCGKYVEVCSVLITEHKLIMKD